MSASVKILRNFHIRRHAMWLICLAILNYYLFLGFHCLCLSCSPLDVINPKDSNDTLLEYISHQQDIFALSSELREI